MEENRKEADNDNRTACLPLYLQRLLKQLEEAVEQKNHLGTEPGETPISFDLLRAASRVLHSEVHLRREHLGESKWSVFNEAREKARNDAWLDKRGDNPYADIRGYVRNARLPPLPWCLEVTKAEIAKEAESTVARESTATNTFATTGTFAQPRKGGQTTERKPDCVRKLRHIEKIPYEEFRSRVQTSSNTLPVGFQPAPGGIESAQPGFWDGDEGDDAEYLSLKADGFKVSKCVRTAPETEKEVADWIEGFPGMTAARVLHVCDSETLGWAYRSVHGKNTRGMLSDLCWQRTPPGNSEVKEETTRRLVLEVKAPWVLDLELFNKFVTTPNIPTSDQIRKAKTAESAAVEVDSTTIRDNSRDETAQSIKQPSIRFSKVQNIWAQIYDYCVAQGNFFFILTTYDHWVFGVFSADYTEAQVTDPLAYDSSEPNILECLLYWTQSARLVPGMFEIPWPVTFDINTADTPRVDIVEVCIKNNALHLCRMYQDTKNRARQSLPNNTRITEGEIRPRPDPLYAVACRFAGSLGRDLTQIINQKTYEERWIKYVGDGIQLRSDSQEIYEESTGRLEALVRAWNDLGGEEFWKAYCEIRGMIEPMLQYDSATDMGPIGLLAGLQLSHGLGSTSHGSNQDGRPRASTDLNMASGGPFMDAWGRSNDASTHGTYPYPLSTIHALSPHGRIPEGRAETDTIGPNPSINVFGFEGGPELERLQAQENSRFSNVAASVHHSKPRSSSASRVDSEATSPMDVDVSYYLSKPYPGDAGVTTSPSTPCSFLSAASSSPSPSPSRFRRRPSSTSAPSAVVGVTTPSYQAGSDTHPPSNLGNRKRGSSGSDVEGSRRGGKRRM